MASVLPRLLAMQRELNALIAELQGGSSAPSTPEVKPETAVAEAPKKRSPGRPRKIVSEEDKEAAKKAGAEAAGAISDAASSASEKPKRVLSPKQLAMLRSPEHQAKMKAGREARKERLKAEKAAETASSAASVGEPDAEAEDATE
jgi:hypothetical protein